MQTFRYRDFPVYQRARKLRNLIRPILRRFPTQEKYLLVDQLKRASLSVVLNIAEGSAKRSDKEFCKFIEVAIASLNEVSAGLECALDDGLITKDEYKQLESESQIVARQLGGLMKKLRTS